MGSQSTHLPPAIMTAPRRAAHAAGTAAGTVRRMPWGACIGYTSIIHQAVLRCILRFAQRACSETDLSAAWFVIACCHQMTSLVAACDATLCIHWYLEQVHSR